MVPRRGAHVGPGTAARRAVRCGNGGAHAEKSLALASTGFPASLHSLRRTGNTCTATRVESSWCPREDRLLRAAARFCPKTQRDDAIDRGMDFIAWLRMGAPPELVWGLLPRIVGLGDGLGRLDVFEPVGVGKCTHGSLLVVLVLSD